MTVQDWIESRAASSGLRPAMLASFCADLFEEKLGPIEDFDELLYEPMSDAAKRELDARIADWSSDQIA